MLAPSPQKTRQPHATLSLSYRPPFDWETLLATLRAHQLPDLETVDETGYERVFETQTGPLGVLRVTHPDPRKHAFQLIIHNASPTDIPAITQTVRRIFDLDADPSRIREVMALDADLAAMWDRHPGLRIARSFSRFETLITTILGQLVSVSFGRTLTRELMHCAGSRATHPTTGEPVFLFPTPEQLVAADLASVRTSVMRRTAIRSIASLVVNGDLPLVDLVPHKHLRKTLLAAPGIGAWSAEYIAMRGFADDDAFPATDYVLKQELKRHPAMKVSRVRPLRAYAAIALWKTFAHAKGVMDESVV